MRVVYVKSYVGIPGKYKIGCTSDINRRYNSAKMRESIVITIPCKGYERDLESRIHELMRRRSIVGYSFEDFMLLDSDLRLLETISKSSDPESLVNTLLDLR